MALVKAITKHGNSAGIILDQALLKVVGWDIGTEVELQVKGRSIVLTRHKGATPVPPLPHESPDK
jgi:antitoxin component of MazEF toxin-antitoxin module